MKLLRARYSVVLLLLAAPRPTQAQTTITFDDLAPGNSYAVVPNGYGYSNLLWYNFGVINGVNQSATSGYRTGVISSNNVAFNIVGDPASIQTTGGATFNLVSGYLTAQAVNGLQVRVQGASGTNILYDNTYTLNPSGPLFVQFNYNGITGVSFTPSPSSPFALDNLTIEPASSSTNPCVFSISPADGVAGYNVETDAVSVTTSADCTWTVSNGTPWITILSSLTNTGPGTVLYEVESNSTTLPRSGNIYVAGQTFPVLQYSLQPTNATLVDVGDIIVSNLGHVFNRLLPRPLVPLPYIADYLIDQSQSTGGGATLQSATIDWSTNRQFVLTVSAPPGMKFLVQVPDNQTARFSGYLWWLSSDDGESPPGIVAVTFSNLEGALPDFSQSFSVLSDSDGFFGVQRLVSTPFMEDLAFTSMTITGTVVPQFTTSGSQEFTPQVNSSLQIDSTAFTLANDPGPFVFLVPQGTVMRSLATVVPTVQVNSDSAGNVTLNFTGTLQSSTNASGPFNDVDGNPLGSYSIPAGNQDSQQFFRTRNY
jgi:hypothetical protein